MAKSEMQVAVTLYKLTCDCIVADPKDSNLYPVYTARLIFDSSFHAAKHCSNKETNKQTKTALI